MGGETAGRTQKIQTGNPKEERQADKKEKKEQAERPQSLQEKLCVLAVCDSMKIVDVPEEGSRCFIYGTAQRRQRNQRAEMKVGKLEEDQGYEWVKISLRGKESESGLRCSKYPGKTEPCNLKSSNLNPVFLFFDLAEILQTQHKLL